MLCDSIKNTLFGSFMFLLSAVASPATAQDDRYLDAMPEPAQVLRDYSDPDPYKSAVMQHAALLALTHAIEERTSKRRRENMFNAERWFTPAERTKHTAYQRAWSQIVAKIKSCTPPGCDQSLYSKQFKQYATDDFRRSVLEKYLKGSWLEEHDRIRAENRKDVADSLRRTEKERQSGSNGFARAAGTSNPLTDVAGNLKNEYKTLYPGLFFSLFGGILFCMARAFFLRSRVKPEVSTVRGEVTSTKTWSETQVTGSGGGYVNPHTGYATPVTISSTSTRWDRFFLKLADGKQTEVCLPNLDVGCGEGHDVTLYYGRVRSKQVQRLLAVANNSTGRMAHTGGIPYIVGSAWSHASKSAFIATLAIVALAHVFVAMEPVVLARLPHHLQLSLQAQGSVGQIVTFYSVLWNSMDGGTIGGYFGVLAIILIGLTLALALLSSPVWSLVYARPMRKQLNQLIKSAETQAVTPG